MMENKKERSFFYRKPFSTFHIQFNFVLYTNTLEEKLNKHAVHRILMKSFIIIHFQNFQYIFHQILKKKFSMIKKFFRFVIYSFLIFSNGLIIFKVFLLRLSSRPDGDVQVGYMASETNKRLG